MEDKEADRIRRNVTITRRFLLIHVHVSQLCIEVLRKLVADPCEESVLVESIVRYIAAEIQEHFVGEYGKGYLRCKFLTLQRYEEGEVIANAKGIDVSFLLLVGHYFFIEPLFQSQPLQSA